MECYIDDQLSIEFERQKKDLKKKYRRIDLDVAGAFERIRENPRQACRAVPVPGYAGAVWKYRFPNSDNNRGASSGYRVMVYFQTSTNTLFPFCIYDHGQYVKQPSDDSIRAWLEEVMIRAAKGGSS